MKLGEFKERIEKTRGLIRRGHGVCDSLGISLLKAAALFGSLFAPCGYDPFKDELYRKVGYDDKYHYWLGHFNEQGIERRLFYLDMFEQYCIVFKVYKEF